MMLRRLSRILLPAIFTAAPAWPQSVPVKSLSQPNATFHHGFTRVEGIRELSDGRVIVLDIADATVQLIDSAWSGMRQIGRRGAGPAEYRTPYKLFALPAGPSGALTASVMRAPF
jgi:hypothetical protein